MEFFHGGPREARTLDTLLKSSSKASVVGRAHSIKQHALRRMRQWMLGSAAVRISRQMGDLLEIPP